mmetsp:Transcript_15578/g.13619  ORF Transcript_15578/g.13619 Transcript_15578/m.13619 type:complete len:286 (+) Transcript_15578:13-870(+)
MGLVIGYGLVASAAMDLEQLDAKLPDFVWDFWPKTYNGTNLLFFHNKVFREFENQAWYGPKVGKIFFLDTRYKLVYAICNEDFDMIKEVYDQGYDFNSPLDFKRGLNAYTLATELDKLEVLHFIELLAKVSGKVGPLNVIAERNENTTIPETKFHDHQMNPLMMAVNNWNVRMIEYLIARNVNPTYIDKYGFNAKNKADIRNLNTISKIIDDYQENYDPLKADKDYEEKLEEESKVLEYKKVYLRDPTGGEYLCNPPSKLFKYGHNPFIDVDNSGYVIGLFDLDL